MLHTIKFRAKQIPQVGRKNKKKVDFFSEAQMNPFLVEARIFHLSGISSKFPKFGNILKRIREHLQKTCEIYGLTAA